MAYKIRLYKGDEKALEYDIRVETSDGRLLQERRKVRPEYTPKDPKKYIDEGKIPTDLERWLDKRERNLLQAAEAPKPIETKPSTITLREWAYADAAEDQPMSPYLLACLADGQKLRTVNIKRSVLRNWLLPSLGDKPLDKIINADISALKKLLLANNLADKSRNLICVHLGTCLNTAVEEGIIDAKMCTIKSIQVSKKGHRHYSKAELRDLVSVANPAQRVMILLGAQAGLRAGEMVTLEWPDIDRENGRVNIRRTISEGRIEDPKGRRTRGVPLSTELLRALDAYEIEYKTRPNPTRSNRVFLSNQGNPLKHQTLFREWLRICEGLAGLPVVGSIHVLRHTFCSHLAGDNTPVTVIRDLAGHANITVTETYMGVAPGADSEAIDRVFSKPQPKGGPAPLKLAKLLKKRRSEKKEKPNSQKRKVA